MAKNIEFGQDFLNSVPARLKSKDAIDTVLTKIKEMTGTQVVQLLYVQDIVYKRISGSKLKRYFDQKFKIYFPNFRKKKGISVPTTPVRSKRTEKRSKNIRTEKKMRRGNPNLDVEAYEKLKEHEAEREKHYGRFEKVRDTSSNYAKGEIDSELGDTLIDDQGFDVSHQ